MTNMVSTLSETLFSTRNRTLVRNLCFEIAQPRPERALVQVHFGTQTVPHFFAWASTLPSWPYTAVSIQLRDTSS